MVVKKRILWVDDQPGIFERNADTLKPYLQDHGITIEIDWARDATEATFRVVSEKRPYDLVLMDLDLSKSNSKYQGDWVTMGLVRDAPGTRIIVVSSHVGDAKFSPILEGLVRKRVILGYYDVADSRKWKKAILRSLQVETPRILHLADLRCEGAARGKASWTPWTEAREYLRQVTRRLSPNLIVVSGGLTERGTWPEFQHAAEFLRSLGDGGPGKADRLVVVPGSSDVLPSPNRPSLGWTNYARFILEEAGSKEILASMPGLDLVTDNGSERDVDWEQRYFYVLNVNDNLRTVVAGFNSATAACDSCMGEIHTLQLEEVTQRLGKLPARCAPYLKIAVLAHPLPGPLPGAGTGRSNTLANADQLLRVLSARRFDLVLHGGESGPNAYLLQPLLMPGANGGKPFVVAAAGRNAPMENVPIQISLNLIEGRFTDWDDLGLKITSFRWSPDGENVSDVECQMTTKGASTVTGGLSRVPDDQLEED